MDAGAPIGTTRSGCHLSLALLQIINNRLLHVAVGIPRHVQRDLVEIDALTHLLRQLSLECPGLDREWRRGAAKGMNKQDALGLRRRCVAREEERDCRHGRRRPERTARVAPSRCHILVTCRATGALPLPLSQRSPAAPSIHRDRPPKRDRSGSRKAVMCLICNTPGRA